MYNTYGNLLVEGSSFNGNSNQKNFNGGFYIEFVYCDPGKVDKTVYRRAILVQSTHLNQTISFTILHQTRLEVQALKINL